MNLEQQSLLNSIRFVLKLIFTGLSSILIWILKSTLMKLAVGLLNPSQGAVRVCGRDATTREARARIGFCPDFDRLYARRNDAESINRHLDDTLWLRRAHSIGHHRQTLNLLTYALCVNGLALHLHRRRQRTKAA